MHCGGLSVAYFQSSACEAEDQFEWYIYIYACVWACVHVCVLCRSERKSYKENL